MDETKTAKNDLASLLRDFAQGASNSAATNVAIPVDAIAWLLRKSGVNIPPNPVMGSDWMAEKGLTREPKNKLAGLVGDMAGMVAPFAAAAKAPQIAKGLLAAGDAMPMGSKSVQSMSKASPMADRGAIVWHGSPHKFDAFDASKIGTGEGAQAYGHGLYLAESPSVAGEYRKALTGNHNLDQFNPTVNGEIVNSPVVKNIIRSGRTPEDFISSMQRKLDSQLVDLSKASKADELGIGISDYDLAMQNVNATKKMINEANGYIGKNIKNEPLGSIYKVDLPDEHIAKMLDYDLPINQQSPQVLEALNKSGMLENARKSGGFAEKDYANLMQGRHLLPASRNGGGAESSNMLRDAGIPGIKYLDGGSRIAGQGSSNYVVFPGNERLLKILERNGQTLP
jgi:hypothetical protein